MQPACHHIAAARKHLFNVIISRNRLPEVKALRLTRFPCVLSALPIRCCRVGGSFSAPRPGGQLLADSFSRIRAATRGRVRALADRAEINGTHLRERRERRRGAGAAAEDHVPTPDAPAATSLDAKYLSEGSSPAAELRSCSALHFFSFFFFFLPTTSCSWMT